MSKFAAREPKAFVKFFRDLPEGKSVVLRMAGLKGLGAEVTERDDKPEEAEHELRVTKAAFLVVVKVLASLRQGRPVKLSSDKKSWIVYIGPRP